MFGWDTPPRGDAAAAAATLDGIVTALTLPELALVAAFPALGWEGPGLVVAALNSLLYGVVAALNSLLYGVVGAVAGRWLWCVARARRSRAVGGHAEPGSADAAPKAGPRC